MRTSLSPERPHVAVKHEEKAVRHKIIISGLMALCSLALLVMHIAERDSNYHGDHLTAGVLMLTVAVIIWFLPSEPNKE